MTLNTTYNPTVADGNGTTKEFSYNFNPLAREYLKVSFQINNEWVEQKSGWSATVSENGGVVKFDIAPTTRVAIERDVPEEQPTQYKTSSGFQAEVIEHSFDLLTGMVQELKDETSRSVKVEVGSNISPDEIVSQVERVYDSIDNIDTVGMDIDNVNTVATDIMDVVTVAGIAEQTKNVSDNMAHVVAVDNNKANIDKAVANATNITTVATSINNVNAVAGNKANIDNVAANKTNINNVAANIAAVNNVSENMADVKNAVQSANDARLWAVGTIAEKPEGSSKYWAEQAQQAAQVYDATETVKGIVRLATSDEVTAGTNDSAAITPLKLKQNLDTKQDKSTAVNYNNISNCLLEIPQDIKLELNNGTLTLKAGSKVYVPNGSGVFDVVTITSDKSYFYVGETLQGFLWITNNNILDFVAFQNCYSGKVAPQNSGLWYDTANNLMKFSSDGGNTWVVQKSLPLASVSLTSGIGATSIDQVFNGFGYIGSTVFALPGVKGLIPNGRNADGSLKSIEFTINSVLTTQVTSNVVVGVRENAMGSSGNYLFDEISNQNLNSGAFWNVATIGDVIVSSGTITSFTPKTVFHALDYNDAVKYSDRETVVGWGIPDYNSGITLTFNKVITNAGESKTMAKSGLFCFEFLVNNVISTLYFYVNNSFVGKIGNTKTSVAFWDEINFPVTKGDVVKIKAETEGGFTAAFVESYLFPYKGSMYE